MAGRSVLIWWLIRAARLFSLTFGRLGRVPVITDEASLARALNEVGDAALACVVRLQLPSRATKAVFLVARIDNFKWLRLSLDTV